MKPISQQLSELSIRAKAAEDRVATAQTEARERFTARREQVAQETQAALERVRQGFADAKTEVQDRMTALQTKVSADIQNLKDRFSRARQEHEARRAEAYAEDTAYDAVLAIDYAIAAVSMAELAALDAIAASEQAETQLIQPTPTPA